MASGTPDGPSVVECDVGGSVRIGGGVTLAALAAHPDIRERFAVVATACEQTGEPAAGTPTLTSHLSQRPQCPVFRRNVSCHKNGGHSCPAHDGENATLAILEGGPCWSVHPSDVAVALVAVDAMIEVDGPSGPRSVGAAYFFVLPAHRMDREIALGNSERIVAVLLPAEAAGGLQRFTKLTQPDALPAAFVSLAVTRRADGDVRLVLGGVSPRPYRIYNSVEEEAMSGGLDEETIADLAERALLDAEPLSQNGYKVELAALLLRDAIRLIAEG